MTATPEQVQQAAHVQAGLRAALKRLTETHQATIADLATAMMYEVTSLTAAVSSSQHEAFQFLDDLQRTQRHQIRAFGVGHVHP